MTHEVSQSLLAGQALVATIDVKAHSVEQLAAFLIQKVSNISSKELAFLLLSQQDIDPLYMAKLLSDVGFDINQTAQALVDNYDDLTAPELVLILKDKSVYPNTTRDEMITVLLAVEFNLSITLNAINPAYPSFNVLIYNKGFGGILSAKPGVKASDTVFFYCNSRSDKWNFQMTKAEVESVLQNSDMSVTTNADKEGYGLFRIGTHARYYYSMKLFPQTDMLYWQIYSLMAYSCGKQATFVTVLAKEKWQSSGVEVSDKHPVNISYKSGSWTINPNEHAGKRYDSAGVEPPIKAKSGYTLAGANEGALIGRVERETFVIGLKATVPSDVNGELLLCVNDDLDPQYGDGFADNEGEVNMNILT